MDTTNFKYETDILLKEYFATEDEEARRKIVSGIVELNYRLIYKIVGEDWDWCDDFEELINVAIIAIIEKTCKYKINSGANYWSYMEKYMNQYIIKYLNENSVQSYYIGMNINKIKNCVRKNFPQYLSHLDQLKDIAPQLTEKLNMSEYEIRSAIDILNKSNIISLDDTVITPAGGINPEKASMINLSMEELGDIIKNFSDEEKELLLCIYDGYISKPEIVNERLCTEYSADEIEAKVMHLKIKIRSIYRKKNRNKEKESDKENNVHHINAEKLMNIIQDLTGK
jgi:RNA polymerase sigma factor (sigma-70 family)